MVRPDLADVHVLGRVDEEAPPKDVEPDEEDGGIEGGGVVGAEEACCEGCFEDEGDCAACDGKTALSVQRFTMFDVLQYGYLPVAPINKNVLRPNLSMYRAVQVLPKIVNVVQQALSRSGMEPSRPSEAYIKTP